MNWTGVYLSVFMLAAIGFGFFWVIKVEYYLGAKVWPVVLGIGLALCAGSMFMPSFLSSALVGILGGTVVWGATELPDQAERVEKGYFPANPNRNKQGEGE